MVRATEQVFHIDRQETEHQLLDFLLVLFVPGLHLPVKRGKFVCSPVSCLAQCLDVAVKHGQELYRVQLLAVKRYLDMQLLATDGYCLSGFQRLPETGEHIGNPRVGHFVLAVTCDNIYATFLVFPDTRHDTAGHCRQRAVIGIEVYAVVKKVSPETAFFCSP